jgi:hypothetical protein
MSMFLFGIKCLTDSNTSTRSIFFKQYGAWSTNRCSRVIDRSHGIDDFARLFYLVIDSCKIKWEVAIFCSHSIRELTSDTNIVCRGRTMPIVGWEVSLGNMFRARPSCPDFLYRCINFDAYGDLCHECLVCKKVKIQSNQNAQQCIYIIIKNNNKKTPSFDVFVGGGRWLCLFEHWEVSWFVWCRVLEIVVICGFNLRREQVKQFDYNE